MERRDVQSDLMGEWHHLRNWLIHPVDDTEREYFKNAKMLVKVLGDLRPGNPEAKARMVFPLMGYLNSLQVIVNPDGLEPGIELSSLDEAVNDCATHCAAGIKEALITWCGLESYMARIQPCRARGRR